jgi:hypothetical protein
MQLYWRALMALKLVMTASWHTTAFLCMHKAALAHKHACINAKHVRIITTTT